MFMVCYFCRILRCDSEGCGSPACARNCFRHLKAQPYANYSFDFCDDCEKKFSGYFERQMKRLRIEVTDDSKNSAKRKGQPSRKAR